MLTNFVNSQWERIPLVKIYRDIQISTKDKSDKSRTPMEALNRINQSKQHIYDFLNLIKDNLVLLDNYKKQYSNKIKKLEEIFSINGNESFKVKIYDLIPEIFDDYGDSSTFNKYNMKRIDVILIENDKRIQEILNGI